MHKLLLPFLLLSLLGFTLQPSIDLTPAQERGKKIFIEGKSSGEAGIIAHLSGIEVPASVLPCASCHGLDGKGRPEGGLTPSDLTWPALTRPYEAHQQSGRLRSAYTEESLGRAISQGLDPDGQELLAAMPRYEMSKEDMSDLIAYLKILHQDDDMGIADDSLRIGTVLPQGRGEAAFQTMAAYLDLVNQAGGLYSRKIRLLPFYTPQDSSIEAADIRTFTLDHNLFAFVGGHGPTATKSTSDRLAVPMIGLVSSHSKGNLLSEGPIFHLLPSLETQVYRLWDFAVKELAAKPVNTVIITGEDEFLVEKLLRYIEKNGGKRADIQQLIITTETAKSAVAEILAGRPEVIIDLVGVSREVTEIASQMKLPLYLLTLSQYMEKDYWGEASGPLTWVAHPYWPAARDSSALMNYQGLASRYHLPENPEADALHSLAGIILFTEVLKTIGRDLSREKLVQSLEGLRHFKTGFVPPLTYTINRHEGSQKVYILSPSQSEGEWELKKVMEGK